MSAQKPPQEEDPLDSIVFDDADLERAQKVSAVFNWATRLVFLTVCAFSAGQGHETLTLVAVTGILAWVLTPAVDIALGACLYAAAPLRKWGVPVAGGIVAEFMFGAMGLALNCGAPLMRRSKTGAPAPDWTSAGYHTIPVILLVVTTLVAAAYQKHYARIIRRAHDQAEQRAAAERAAKQARQDEQRAARQAELEREHARRLELDRADAAAREAEALAAAEASELERVREANRAAELRLEVDRVRLAEQQEANRVRLVESMRTPSAPSPGPRGGSVNGSARGSAPSRSASTTGSANGSGSTPRRSDEERMDTARIFFAQKSAARLPQPTVRELRAHLGCNRDKASEIHKAVAAEEAARAAGAQDVSSSNPTDAHSVPSE